MAIKKSGLYSSLWGSCDVLRSGMDASQYKDYVLVLLFIKYVNDNYAGQTFAPITIPPGASFKDMVARKGTLDSGDQINKKIIAPLTKANNLSDLPGFNDADNPDLFLPDGLWMTRFRNGTSISSKWLNYNLSSASHYSFLKLIIKTRHIKQGRMQEQFTGRIRLV